MVAPDWANVSRETLGQLTEYAALLQKWNPKINLVSPATLDELWDRHIWDSYQLAAMVPDHVARLADIGSGAGLPGIILAIAKPALPIALIERDTRKAAFLRQAVLELQLSNVAVLNQDINAVEQQFDIITARALASLDLLCELSLPILGKDGICLFPKGENFAIEIEEAKKRWEFTHHLNASKTSTKACIVSLTELKPRS